MKVITIEPEQFDSYAKKHKYRNYYQTSTYGNLMKQFNYEVIYIGINNDEDRLIGASLLLVENSVMKTKIAYAPRGILFDFKKRFIKTWNSIINNGSCHTNNNQR